jgi:hypothetical protein
MLREFRLGVVGGRRKRCSKWPQHHCILFVHRVHNSLCATWLHKPGAGKHGARLNFSNPVMCAPNGYPPASGLRIASVLIAHSHMFAFYSPIVNAFLPYVP